MLVGAWWLYRSGKEAGKEAQKQESTQETKQQIEEFRKAADAEFERLSAEVAREREEARAQRLASERRDSVLVQTIGSLANQRQSSLTAVGAIPDADLHARVVQSLALRSPSETSVSCFTPREERKILETLTDYPACQKQTQLQTEQIAEIRTQVASLRDEVKAVEQQAQAERQLRQRYAEFYATAYNLLRQKKRSWKCLGLWRCGKEPTLPVPSPDTLSPSPAR